MIEIQLLKIFVIYMVWVNIAYIISNFNVMDITDDFVPDKFHRRITLIFSLFFWYIFVVLVIFVMFYDYYHGMKNKGIHSNEFRKNMERESRIERRFGTRNKT